MRLAGEIVAGMEPGRLYVLGPGATMRRIKRRLGFEGTLPMLRSLRERHHWLGVATGKGRRGLDDALAGITGTCQ